MTCIGAAPPNSNVPPTANADIALADGKTLHARELPLGRIDGVILDGATFDPSGTRMAFLATFPNGAIEGDWRRTRPTQAFVADVSRRTLEELTSDGRASAIRWSDATHVAVTDGGANIVTAVMAGASMPRGRAHVEAITTSTSGTLVSPPDEFRLQVLKTSANSYAVGQVGAVRLRTIAVARDRANALVGALVVWIDGSKNGGSSFARSGPDTVLPPSFPGSAYGDSLTPLLPLGHVVYQGGYRNGVAYFAFSLGLRRIVAATTDFVNYSYPVLPKQPAFTAGDGLGAGADGVLYFAGPEGGSVQFWRGGKYVERSLRFPDNASNGRRLFDAIARISPRGALDPPLRPDVDALDAALLEWRVYPIGDATGDAWIASHLGRAFVAGSDARFKEIAEPAFPFVVLGRTDDGRLWGATPQQRTTRGSALTSSPSRLMVSRDGVHWNLAATLAGDAAAVGLHDGTPWVAMTAFEGDAAGVEVVRLDGSTSNGAPTGAVYAGEDIFFADTDGGWFLVCGGEPGTRADDGSGPLVAHRLDAASLFSFDRLGANRYLHDRLDPMHASGSDRPSPMLAASADALAALGSPYIGTIVSDEPAGFGAGFRRVSIDAEREFEVEYAWRPYPLARASTTIAGDAATVRRTLERGPLAIDGQTERWRRDASGTWRLSTIDSRWHV
jgi:hypothetical protein